MTTRRDRHASRAADAGLDLGLDLDLDRELRLMTDDLGDAPRPVLQRMAELVDALEAVGARYAICGAVAMGAHGARRFTEDIDVLVAADDLEPLVARLSATMNELARQPTDGPAKQVRLRPKSAAGVEGVDIDLLVPVDAVEDWALQTAVRGRAHDRKVDVVTAEALVVMKLRAYCSDPESRVGRQHQVDAMTVLATAHPDLELLRHFVSSHPALAAALEEALAAPPPRGRLPR